MRRVLVVAVAVLVGACSSPATAPGSLPSSAEPPAVPSPSPNQGTSEEGFVLPTGPIPTRARPLARDLELLHRQLPRAIDRWLDGAARVRSRIGRAIALASLRRQKILRKLSGNLRLERRLLRLVPRGLARFVKAHTHASRGLSNLVAPVRRFHLPTKQPDPPHMLRRYYKAAQRRFNVDWELLAAINLIETRFGRLKGPSTSGAQGPMQFMPATWAAYGNGDVNNPWNAIMGAARYLRANGAMPNLRGAVWNYNHADEYVDAVINYYRQMKRDDRHYYSYYFWQVFVKTTRGDIQLTGPGGRRPWII